MHPARLVALLWMGSDQEYVGRGGSAEACGVRYEVLARLAQVFCVRRHLAEGVCLQGNTWMGHTVSPTQGKLGRSVGAMLLSAGGPVFRLGVGQGDCAGLLLYSRRSLSWILAPPAHTLGLVNKSSSYIPQMIFKQLLLSCISAGLFFCAVSLR